MANKKRIVLLRSRDSGVWIGEFVSQDGGNVKIKNARKIWRWRGANTTSELALRGCLVEYSRVAEPVTATVINCCEILESNQAAYDAIAKCGWSA